ncbi:AMP-binding protein [Hahella aquimaris]|uniref:AMP-binding protein n=1 Tax=Hahella sp. HNIBRBA332 TaxID=3015983 RepID=UPI00273AFFA1|nr:AMP-binding protein [Hahella sp. HNIBRBA332]WLQ16392.1 AMP-binding protein [Hahella sp. HNIBRBA332]
MNKLTFELSRSQQAVFKMEAFHLSGRRFYLGGVARLHGEVSLERLTLAAERVMAAQDVFRIGFIPAPSGAEWRGVRHDKPLTVVETVDFSHRPDPEQAFASWAERRLLLDEDLARAAISVFAVQYRENLSGWFVKAHHAAADGAALALLMEQLANALDGAESAQGESPVFSVIAEREQDYENSQRWRRDSDYWAEVFGQEPAAPINSRWPIGDYRGGEARSMRIRVPLPREHNDRLRAFKAQGGSVFRLFFAAVAYAQMVVEDADAVLLQAPMLNRWSDDEKRTIAMAVAPVMVPVSRAAGETVADCYRGLRKPLQKALAHSRYAPGARWGEFASAQWKRIVPAFGVSYQTGAFQKNVSGAQVEIDHLQAVEALFATVHIHDRFEDGSIQIEADFRQQWSSSQCKAFLNKVIDYAMEAAADVTGVNPPVAAIDARKSVSPIGYYLTEAFARYADHCLFKCETGASMSYREGWGRLSALRERLRKWRGQDGAGRPVMMLGRRTPDIVLAYLACLMENLTVVPVCPTTPAARLLTIVRSSGVARCLHAGADKALAESLGLPATDVTLAAGEEAGEPTTTGEAAPHDRPAYILYTSGSTGEPKGVAISPLALAHYALAATRAYADERPFNAPLFTSFGFDLTQTSILVPVLSGGFIQPHESDIRDNPELLRRLLADEALTGVKCTPSHLSLLTEHSPPRRTPLTFVVGGEHLSTALVNQALAFFPQGGRVVNEYGPTEATVGCCIHVVSEPMAGDLAPSAVTPIGAALGVARMTVRDAWGECAPQGFKGELWIGGPVLADGYLNNPLQTEAKFVRSRDDGGLWYRSGDLGVQDEQGALHCLGRIDEEFKIRGHRIHPTEIESAVERALAQLGRDERSWELKALKISTQDHAAEPTGEEREGFEKREMVALCSSEPLPCANPAFQQQLRALLPDAWLPGLYCTVKPWPVNANGKVDMAALTAAAQAQLADAVAQPHPIGASSTQSARTFQLPSWLNQDFLQPIWPQGVDLNGSFLEQGGDSIKAIRLAALLAKEGVRVGAGELLSMTALGAVLEKACLHSAQILASADAAATEDVDANWIRYLPSVRWFQRQNFKYGERLQQGVTLTFPAALTPVRIHAAVTAVKARHKIFALRANADFSACRFESPAVEPLSSHVLQPGEALADRLQRLQCEVDMQRQPSAHEIVCDPDSQRNHLIWVCHHLICDVHSWIYLLDELERALEDPDSIGAPTEQGVFLWGKWLRDQVGEDADLQVGENLEPGPAAAPVREALSLSGAALREMAQRHKTDRMQLIAAALLAVLHESDATPAQSFLLFEHHGRLFSEAETPSAWGAHLANAVGWFTGFDQISIDIPMAGEHAYLRAIKSQRHESGQTWTRQLGLPAQGHRPLLCVNDIGFGLESQKQWRHFTLAHDLSGGFRHPGERSVADFDLLIHDDRESGAVYVELRLGAANADETLARDRLGQLNARLSAWNEALQRGDDETGAPPAVLIPSDFPLCQLSQAELDLIINGAAV